MNYLFVINDAPGAGERAYNALRLATSLTADPEGSVRLFFIGDGAWCAVADQKTEAGQHDIEWMLRRFVAGARQAGVCRTCMEARAISPEMLVEGTHRSSIEELSAWTAESDKVLVF